MKKHLLPLSVLRPAGVSCSLLGVQLNKTIQNLVFTMLKDDSEIAAKKSLDIMVELYRKRVWVVSWRYTVKRNNRGVDGDRTGGRGRDGGRAVVPPDCPA